MKLWMILKNGEPHFDMYGYSYSAKTRKQTIDFFCAPSYWKEMQKKGYTCKRVDVKVND